MFKSFYPDVYVDSIFHIPYEKLRSKNIVGLVFDVDNTLVPFDIEEPTEKITELFLHLKDMGFRICLLSNNNEDRVKKFNNNLKLFAISKAGKPKLGGITKALALLETSPENTVLIGDQVFTDVWCGKRKGLRTILVKPIAQRDEFTVKLKRGLEKQVINMYLKQKEKK